MWWYLPRSVVTSPTSVKNCKSVHLMHAVSPSLPSHLNVTVLLLAPQHGILERKVQQNDHLTVARLQLHSILKAHLGVPQQTWKKACLMLLYSTSILSPLRDEYLKPFVCASSEPLILLAMMFGRTKRSFSLGFACNASAPSTVRPRCKPLERQPQHAMSSSVGEVSLTLLTDSTSLSCLTAPSFSRSSASSVRNCKEWYVEDHPQAVHTLLTFFCISLMSLIALLSELPCADSSPGSCKQSLSHQRSCYEVRQSLSVSSKRPPSVRLLARYVSSFTNSASGFTKLAASLETYKAIPEGLFKLPLLPLTALPGWAKLMRRYVKSPSTDRAQFLIMEMWKGTGMPKMGTMTVSCRLSTYTLRLSMSLSTGNLSYDLYDTVDFFTLQETDEDDVV